MFDVLTTTYVVSRTATGVHLRQRMNYLVATLVCLVSTLGTLEATTLTRATLDDLIQKSTAIVHGKVLGSSPVSRGQIIYTAYRIQVLERWKGAQDAQVEVMIPGGVLNGVRQNVSGAPQLAEGTEYVFFLWTGQSRITHLLGLSQGVLDMTQSALGETMVIRSASEATLLDATGKVTQAERISMKLSDFRTRVATMLRTENK
jgi:hypothetical protein